MVHRRWANLHTTKCRFPNIGLWKRTDHKFGYTKISHLNTHARTHTHAHTRRRLDCCVMVSTHTHTHSQTPERRSAIFTHLKLWRFVPHARPTPYIHQMLLFAAAIWLCGDGGGEDATDTGTERDTEKYYDGTEQHCGTEAIDLYTFRLQSAGRSLNLWIFSSVFFFFFFFWLFSTECGSEWQMVEIFGWFSVDVSENRIGYCFCVFVRCYPCHSFVRLCACVCVFSVCVRCRGTR